MTFSRLLILERTDILLQILQPLDETPGFFPLENLETFSLTLTVSPHELKERELLIRSHYILNGVKRPPYRSTFKCVHWPGPLAGSWPPFYTIHFDLLTSVPTTSFAVYEFYNGIDKGNRKAGAAFLNRKKMRRWVKCSRFIV